MPPKKQIPQPIDRPLSRAYLREFSGWSTAYPPTLSDPTSLRIMENTWVQRDGSIRQRPGLRHLSYTFDGHALGQTVVGTHEAFWLENGSKAYLFAVRETGGTVGFRVLVFDSGMSFVMTPAEVGFTYLSPESAVNFRSDCTYVKYLQIDNKIFALSDNDEPMRLFTVGDTHTVKVLAPITRPEFTIADKLTVMHPSPDWITQGAPTAVRYNLLVNPSSEVSGSYTFGAYTQGTLAASPTPVAGSKLLRLESLPQRTNLMYWPLHSVSTTGLTGWAASAGVSDLSAFGDFALATVPAGAANRMAYVRSGRIAVPDGVSLVMAFDVTLFHSNSVPGALFRAYNSAGAEIGDGYARACTVTSGRAVSAVFIPPAGTATIVCYPNVKVVNTATSSFSIRNVLVCDFTQPTTPFSGASGSNYFWTGAVNGSPSVYHPPQTLQVSSPILALAGVAGGQVCGSGYFRSGSTARDIGVTVYTYSTSGTITGTFSSTTTQDNSTGYTRLHAGVSATPAASTKVSMDCRILAVPRGEYHYVDARMLEEKVTTPGTYFDGDTPDTSTAVNDWLGAANASTSIQVQYATGVTAPTPATPTDRTLISNSGTPAGIDNIWNFGFFYVFANEIGETWGSQVTVVRTYRRWSAWMWLEPFTGTADKGEPDPSKPTSDPAKCADQLVAVLPNSAGNPVFDVAKAQGAVSWSLYMFTWSDQDPVPVTALRVGQKAITPTSTHATDGWIRVGPTLNQTGDEIALLPRASDRDNPNNNYTVPSAAANGLVAADRMILVADPTKPAVIKWSSNQQGEYTNFSASKGGGYKTLTSGNLMLAATVRLWQNPQSVDTLTVLCIGTDGRSTGYYMMPATVSSQSEQANIMGFEETTATPGTVATYGAEVFNNALYHPLDDQLMKSTANNYNISHKSQTDQIRNVWNALTNKHRIVSSQHDGRLYFIVHNVEGAPLEPGCRGNEIWVFDGGSETGNWSRWMIPAHSLRKIEQGSQIYMSVVRPDGIFYLDPDYDSDDHVVGTTVQARYIPWKLETNTQGANRAHDAWAHLQQLTISWGNMLGQIRWGIRGFDLHGKAFDISKITRDDGSSTPLTWDLEDHLQIRRDLKEWFFYAETILDEDDVVVRGIGQINSVAYRYTPSTVNTGYEYGSVETFEYGFNVNGIPANTTNGIPVPYIDTRRP